MTDLLPCPFCGGTPKLRTHRTGEDSEDAYVECPSCEVRTTYYEDAYAPTADAIAAWNRRAPSPLPEDANTPSTQSHVPMEERTRMQLTPGYLNSFETVISALEKGGRDAQAAGFIAHGACLLHAAVELRHVWDERKKTASSRRHVLTDDGWAYFAPTIGGEATSRDWQRNYPSLWHAVSAASQDLLVAAGLVKNKQVRARLMLHWDTVNGIAHALDRFSPPPPDVRIVFGLEAQGHIPAVEAALAEGADWQEIGRRIGWNGETAKTYYERHLARLATKEGSHDAG